MKCNRFLCLGVVVLGMVAFSANVDAGPRGGDSVTPVSAEVVKSARVRDGAWIMDIRDELGQMEVIYVGARGGVAAAGTVTPVWDSAYSGYIYGPSGGQSYCADAVDMFSATVGWGDQYNFGNGAGASGIGYAELAQYRVIWCSGYSEYFNGPDICNEIAGDDNSCALSGQSVCGGSGSSSCICVDCYDGSAPYFITVGMYDSSDPCTDGNEILISGTEVTFQSSAYRLGGQRCTTAIVALPAKTFVPSGSYFELKIGLEDAWFPLGLATTVGTPGNHLDWWIDDDFDGCYDTFSCFSGSVWPSVGAPWVAGGADAAAAYTLSLLPVSVDETPANGGDTSGVSGNTITVGQGGRRLVMEFWWSDWSAGPKGDIAIQAFQANLDSSGFTSALQGAITYADIDCATNADCWGGGRCGFVGGGADMWIDKCEPGYMGTIRSDYIFSTLPYCVGGDNEGDFCFGGFECTGGGACRPGSSIVAGIDLTTPDLRFGASLASAPVTSSGGPTYAATILTEISADALGTFTIWPEMDPAVGLLGALGTAWEGRMLPLLGLEPAIINVVEMIPCCHSDFTCSLVPPTDCDGIAVGACAGDGNGDGRDDACEGIIPAGDDCWVTGAGRTKFDFCDDPIPADFFGPGSDPFDGQIALKGTGQSAADTIVRRLDSLLLPDAGAQGTIDIEIVELNLQSVDPITVTFNGGQNPETWLLEVDLSPSTQPTGLMTITKTHDNGGSFLSNFYVYPRFTFTKLSDPSQIRILDMGGEGMPPLQLETRSDEPWVHQLSASYVATPCGVNFAPGIVEDVETGEQCCVKVGHSAGPGHAPGHIHETSAPNCTHCPSGACCLGKTGCQLAEPAGPATAEVVCDGMGGTYMGDGTDCTDSDDDGLADVTETDANCCYWNQADACNNGTDGRNYDTDGDGCSDGDEVMLDQTDPCDPCDFNPVCGNSGTDCNGNGIRDECDVSTGFSKDCNTNGVPDECEPGACCGISVTTGTAACVTAQNKAQCDALNPPGDFLGPCEDCPGQDAGINVHDGLLIIHSVSNPIECPGDTEPAVFCDPTDPKIDPWMSLETDESNPQICHNFGAVGGGPIPADFFCPTSDPTCGSDPINYPICLEGLPLGPTAWGDFGDADTLISRSDDPFDRCEMPSTAEATVDIEIVALSLIGVNPVTITYGGGSPEPWTVVVGLSSVGQDTGSLTARKTHCNGGVYSAILPVLPKFTFTSVNNPSEVRVFDTGLVGLDSVTFTMPGLDDAGAANWVHDVDENLGVAIDPCSDFHPGILDDSPTLDCDCNGNDVRDKCDIESIFSPDCNGNGIPDWCDIDTGVVSDCQPDGIPDVCQLPGNDCNTNGSPDECDIAPGGSSDDCTGDGVPDECEQDCDGNSNADSCDIADCTGSPSCADCNSNGIPDGCEPDCNGNGVADSCDMTNDVLHDIDGNGIPDECDCGVASAAVSAAPAGDTGHGSNVRFLSISVGDAGLTRAIRVRIPGLGTMWAAAPVEVTENAGKTDPNDPQVAGFPTYWASTLTCDPQYVNWSAYGVVHIYHEVLVPGGSFLIDVIDQGCAANLAGNYSSAFEFNTSAWGDVVGNCASAPCTAPDGSVDVTLDVTAILNKFKNLSGAPIKARADIEPAVPDHKINISDVTMALDAFKGFSYPFPPASSPCP